MTFHDEARGTGVVFIAAVLGTIATLLVGLGIASWFESGNVAFEPWGYRLFAHATTSVGLASVEVCAYGECATAWTYDALGAGFGTLALVTLGLAIAFGVLVLWFANRRIASTEVPLLLKGLALAVGLAALAATVACMFVRPPGMMIHDFVLDDVGLGTGFERSLGLATGLSLGIGGFVTIAGIVLGGFVVWFARTPEAAAAHTPRRRALLRSDERPGTARGPETDPFRMPPAPAPLAVVRHHRPSAPPVIESADGEPPKLLR